MRQRPERLVFLDETSVQTNLTCLRGRAPAASGSSEPHHSASGARSPFIAGLTHDSLIAPWVIDGAMNGEVFATYVSTQLAPALEPGTVVILDNLGVHHTAAAAAALRQRDCWFLYLPPYSPDLNPIEQAFSKLKAHLRRIGARTFDALIEALGAICGLFSPDECRSYPRMQATPHCNVRRL